MSEEEQSRVVQSLMKQKIGAGANSKSNKAIQEFAQRKLEQANQEEKIKVRIAKMSLGTVVKWKRKKKDTEEAAKEEGDGHQESQGKKSYSSRMLSCTRCGLAQETSWMQLRTIEGYRALHCKGCARQERCARSLCQCGVVWHTCQIHREDPISHSSKKGKKGVRRESRGQEGEKEERDEKSTRTAPATFQEESRQKRRRQKKDKSNHKQSMLTSHATFVLSTQPPKQEFIDRVRRRNAPKTQREAGGDEKEESQKEKKERSEEKKGKANNRRHAT